MSQVDILREDIERLRVIRNGAEETVRQLHPGTVEHGTKQAELTSIVEQIKQREKELEAIQASEAAIEAVEAEQESIEIEGIALRDMFLSPTHYEFFLLWRKQVAGEEAAARAVLDSSYKSEIESLEAQVTELQGEVADYQFLQSSAAQLQLTIDDLNAKRDAAGEKIAELEGEVDRLTKDNESLRKQLESKPANGPTNTNANLAEMAKQILAAKPGIYNKRWRDENRKTHYIANLSATGEEIEIPFLEIGKYREETEEAAERFRQEKAAEEAASMAEQNIELNVRVPEFRDEEDTTSGLAEDAVDGETLEEAPVTQAQIRSIEERLQRLEQQENGRAVA